MKLELASSTLRRVRAATMRRKLNDLAERLTPPSFPQIRLAEFCQTGRTPGFARTQRSAS